MLISFNSCSHPTLTCDNLRTGNFYYYPINDTTKYKIERNDSVQIETNLSTGKSQENKITWLNKCTYKLTPINVPKNVSGADSFLLANPTEITILEIAKQYYIFTCRIDSAEKHLTITDTLFNANP